MLNSYFTLAEASWVTEGITLMVVGMGVVFSSLVLLLIVIKTLNTGLAEKPKAVVASTTPAPAPASEPAAKTTDGIEPEVLAVISAAVAAVVGGSHRIRRVDVLTGQHTGSNWARHGRRAIMTSHRPKS